MATFGGYPTFRVAPAYLIPETGTKLKGSVGSGFKAPTLDELYDSYPAFGFFANPNLRPETSLGYDFGFEQSLWNKQVEFGSTYFHNDIKNLIEINSDRHDLREYRPGDDLRRGKLCRLQAVGNADPARGLHLHDGQ